MGVNLSQTRNRRNRNRPRRSSFKLHETVRLLVRHGGKAREALALSRGQVAQHLTWCENPKTTVTMKGFLWNTGTITYYNMITTGVCPSTNWRRISQPSTVWSYLRADICTSRVPSIHIENVDVEQQKWSTINPMLGWWPFSKIFSWLSIQRFSKKRSSACDTSTSASRCRRWIQG